MIINIKFILIINLIIIFNCKKNIDEISSLNGVYIITSLSNNYYFAVEKNYLTLSINKTQFHIIKTIQNYYLISNKWKKKIGVDENDKIILFHKIPNINISKIYWKLIRIKKNEYLIQNIFNNKFLTINNKLLQFTNKYSFSIKHIDRYIEKIDKNYLFYFIKLYEEGQMLKKKYLKIIDEEPIDVLIKYINLNDRALIRKGIKQINKDYDNEELRYSIRSILQYIPWIRKIFILMPNKKVKFLKSVNEIKEKIIYVKDKDLLGYDSANIHAFTFNLYKMDKFGISKNFIYMEDDFFIGKPLKKSDFFYYDIKNKKVLPYLLNSHFKIVNKSQIINEYYNILKYKDSIHPHSRKGWIFSILSTYKYFIDKYNIDLIGIKVTHNAIAENIDDIKEIFEEIKNYEYINETLLYKERHILTLNQPQFLQLYLLNIKHRKVHPIPYKYLRMEIVNKANLNISLFVINTGKHKPTKKQYNIQKIIMEKRFPNPSKYEKISDKNIINNLYIIIHIIFVFIKLLKKVLIDQLLYKYNNLNIVIR